GVAVVKSGAEGGLTGQGPRAAEHGGVELLEMDVVVDQSEGGLDGIDIAQFTAHALPIEQRAVTLFDGEHGGFQVAPEAPEIDAGAVEKAVVLERLIGAPLNR